MMKPVDVAILWVVLGFGLAACDPASTVVAADVVRASQKPDAAGSSAASGPGGQKAATGQSAATSPKKGDPVRQDGTRLITWEDLMPEGEEERLAKLYVAHLAKLYSGGGVAEGSMEDMSVQIGTFNTVKSLDGKRIRIPGYAVPFEYGADAKIKEFLLVPYYGACLHSPPPPPNQTIFVTTEKPIRLQDLAEAVWIEGTIHTRTQETQLADAAYTISLTSIEEYKW